MLKICIYIGINADVTLEDNGRTECEDRARILKQNSQFQPNLKILKVFQSVFFQSVFFQSVFIQSVFLWNVPDLRVF